MKNLVQDGRKINMIKTTEEFWTLIQSMVGKGGMERIASCSVSQVIRRKDGQAGHHYHIVYKIHLYYGPFCVWKSRRKLSMEYPVYMYRHDVINFISKSLSDRKSPYYFNQETGKWDLRPPMVM